MSQEAKRGFHGVYSHTVDHASGVAYCMNGDEHEPHEWWYTSEGGGHMVNGQYADPKRDKQWKCPGREEPAPHPIEVQPPPPADPNRIRQMQRETVETIWNAVASAVNRSGESERRAVFWDQMSDDVKPVAEATIMTMVKAIVPAVIAAPRK